MSEPRKHAVISSLIDPALWDRARWRGVLWSYTESVGAMCALAFENQEPAEQIFRDWQKRLTVEDRYDELRVGVVEGGNRAGRTGYWIYLTTEPDSKVLPMNDQGECQHPDMLMTLSRVHRMDTSPGPQNFDTYFRPFYAKSGRYLLAPAVIRGREVGILAPLAIWKSKISFRKKEEVRPGELDSLPLRMMP